MEKESKNEFVKELFASHPKVDRFYFTSDDQAFFQKHQAENHAKSLQETSVKSVGRSLYEKIQQSIADFTASAKEPNEVPAAPVAEGLQAEEVTAAPVVEESKSEEAAVAPVVEVPAPKAPKKSSKTKTAE